MSVKIRSRLPKGDRDGLQHLTDLLRKERKAVLAVMVVAPDKVTENLDDDDDPYTVNLKVLAIEAPQGLDASALRSMLTTSYERRTGKQPLPFGSLFDELDRAPDDEDRGS